jgi:hypothetical protein
MGYLQDYDVFEKHWDTRETPDAKLIRDRRARELRRQGWTVQIDTKRYNVLEAYVVYWLFGERKKTVEK